MDLLDKKSVKILGVKDFAWSPSANIISYFVPVCIYLFGTNLLQETGNQPARVALMDIPAKTDKYQKNLFNVVDVSVFVYVVLPPLEMIKIFLSPKDNR